MTWPHRRAVSGVGAWLVWALGACSRGGSPDAGAPACFSCHDQGALFAAGAADGVPPREYLSTAGSGFVASAGTLSNASYTFEWPDRGHHDPADNGQCAGCHPVQPDGTGHGVSRFTDPNDDEGCGQCHGWIAASATSSGFLNASGQRPTYQGTFRPNDLLSTGTDAHAQMFRSGYDAPDGYDPKLVINHVEPGCIGCHALSSEAHGQVPSCTDCHRYGTVDQPGSEASAHAAYIDPLIPQNDPAHSGQADCIYCHGSSPTADNVYRAGCYNCHLSAHRPLAVFWPKGN